MTKALRDGVRSRTSFINLFAASSLVIFSLGLQSCADNESGSNYDNATHQLLMELDHNRLLWENSGVSEYSFSINKDCDCPEELKGEQTVSVSELDQEDLNDTGATVSSKAGSLGGRSLSARESEESSQRTQQAQSLRMESIFTDLRQAILQNSVQQVSYNPTFGFPQNVVINTAVQPNNLNQRINRNSDDDDRTPLSNLSIQTRNFQVLRTNNAPQNINLNGQFIRQSNPNINSANQYWVVDNNGRWNQLNVPANIYPTINAIPNQSYVQVNGQWLPGGVNGQGLINLNQINQTQALQNQNNLSGTLYYSVLNNGSFDLDDFYITSDAGTNVFLNLPANLQNQALQLAGQRVNLNGSWSPFFNAPNARFIPNGLNTVNATLEQFTGVLTPNTTFQLPGVQQSNYLLINDYGSAVELQIPANIANSIFNYTGRRVTVFGTRLYAGAYGQPVIYVQSIQEIQNFFTNTQISGTVTAVLPSNGFSTASSVMLQLDTGSSITVQIPANYANPYNPLTAGMRVQISGAWISNSGFGQGIFEARAPIQIVNLGFANNTSYSGYITNIGSVSNGLNCNATQTNYGFTTDNGQQFQLYVTNATQITGQNSQGLNLPFQARVQVTGNQISPGVLQAQTINVYAQPQTTIYGTIIEIGAAGSTFTCTGTLSTYRLLDTNGNAYSITTTPNSVIQGSLGAFLRIGDVVQVTGTMANAGSSFYASQVVTVSSTNSGIPYQPYPSPYASASVFTGTITGEECTTSYGNTYNFVDQSGTLYKVNVNLNQASGIYADVGSSVQITGTLVNNEITAQQIVQLQTFADPLNRTPISGTIISTASTLPSSCNSPVYTYQFQNDNGQIQQLRVTADVAGRTNQPFSNGSRVTVTARANTVNTQIIDAVQIQYQYSAGQNFGIGVQPFTGIGQSNTITGTITASCTNEYYFVDQNGTGYKLQLNNTNTGIYAGVGTKLTVTGQIIGNQIIATNAYPDQSQVFFPTPTQASGTITALVNTETLNCGSTITTYTFQNDNGRTQRLRVANNPTSFSGQYLTTGSRVIITNKVESFDGSVIDALSISQQNLF